jgi:hypothetical protein
MVEDAVETYPPIFLIHHAGAAVTATRHAAVRVWIFPDAAETTTVTKV